MAYWGNPEEKRKANTLRLGHPPRKIIIRDEQSDNQPLGVFPSVFAARNTLSTTHAFPSRGTDKEEVQDKARRTIVGEATPEQERRLVENFVSGRLLQGARIALEIFQGIGSHHSRAKADAAAEEDSICADASWDHSAIYE
ncbi:MAG: hypothetical protein M4579_001239 [Chaenotheca gracillima]|nr:MAG: hypothetical protein M4579_001239 [Chaenotheca gracillima]